MSFSSRFASIFAPSARESLFAELLKRAQRAAPNNDTPSTTTGDDDTEEPPESVAFFDELDDAEPLLTGEQLLLMLRAPVEWLLELADRLAAHVPEDQAAVRRVRSAFIARVAGRPIHLRTTDMLVVFGVLVGALDLDVVIDAVSRTLGDGIATMVATQHANLAAQLAALAEALPMPVHHACAPRQRQGRARQPRRAR
jgi:hypothetical protein